LELGLEGARTETLPPVSTLRPKISPSEKIAAILEERLALMAPSRRLRLAQADEIVRRYAANRSLRILDAGCGDGLLSLSIAKMHPDWTVVGIDIDASLLAGARERARARSLDNVEFVPADLTKNLPQGEFDVVLALECLSEIPDDEAALRAMASALSPGGLFVAQVPDRSWKPILPGSPSTWRVEVRHGYDSDGLAHDLRRAGFDRIEIRPTFHSTVMLAQEVRDRIKTSKLPIRALAFPFMVAAVRLERWGVRLGSSNALLTNAHRAV
jgi:SAM-dependent methyltransferase